MSSATDTQRDLRGISKDFFSRFLTTLGFTLTKKLSGSEGGIAGGQHDYRSESSLSIYWLIWDWFLAGPNPRFEYFWLGCSLLASSTSRTFIQRERVDGASLILVLKVKFLAVLITLLLALIFSRSRYHSLSDSDGCDC